LKASGANANEIKKKVNSLVNNATYLTRFSNEYRKPAQSLVGKYKKTQQEGEPENFVDARDALKVALDTMSTAKNFVSVAKQTQNAEMMAQIPDKEKEQRDAWLSAFNYAKLSLDLRDEESPIDDVNLIRLQYAILLFEAKRFAEAAVLGDFVSRHYPKSGAIGRNAGMVALHSLIGEYNANQTEDKKFEVDHLVSIAEHIAKTWPSDAEADNAWMLLASLAIREKDYVQAAEYLSNVPEESPRRGEADLQAGQSLWSAYVAASRLPEEERPSKAELDAQVQKAQQVLEQGIERMRAGISDPRQVAYNLVAAEMTLAQIYVGAGAPDKAVARLETADSGPLALVRAKSPVVMDKGTFPEDTYKAALQAYVGSQQLEKAEAIMAELEEMVAGKPDAAAQLTRIYIKLGQDLEDHVKRLRELKQTDDLDKVLQTFEAFLTRIAARPSGNTFSSLNWVAETFLRLGSGLHSGDDPLTPQAKTYYEKAVSTYEAMKAQGQSDPAFLPSPQYVTGLDIRIARCKRSLGQYKESLDLLGGILKVNDKILEAQLEGAQTYQAWAKAENKMSYYDSAIAGGRKDRKTRVPLFWGWARIASMVQGDPKYEAIFHEARFNLADCHFRQAMMQSSPDKEKTLNIAARDIIITYKLFPKMGGPEQLSKYNRLLKTIQSAQGNRQPDGLEGLKKPSSQPANASAAR
ncbi:MAG: tetratricopeptide repeat protein, partial [Pirellulales bacterium]